MMLAVKNISRNKIRSILTALGVATGVSVFVVLVSFSDGLKTQINHLLSHYEVDIVVKSRSAASPMYSKIELSDYRDLGFMPGIADLSGMVLGALNLKKKRYFVIAGVSDLDPLAMRIGIIRGRLFEPGKREILFGAESAKLFNYKVNDRILIGEGGLFTIVGIYVTGSRIIDGGCITSINLARKILKKDDTINIALIRIEEGYDKERVIGQIQERFERLTAIDSGELVGHLNLARTVNTASWALSTIALFVCGIIVMNTLVMAIFERTKEIGILMAIGWSRIMIVRTIVLESILLCIGGGISGMVLGLAILWFFNLKAVTGIDWVPVSLTLPIVLKSLGVSLLIGCVSSLYPAYAASRLSPSKALRFE